MHETKTHKTLPEVLAAVGRALTRFHRDERGQAMTEAAIILPIFITTVAMTLELCVLATVKSVVNFGAYSACRAGIVHNADAEWMIFAASVAISPVTQSNILPVKAGTDEFKTYGTWEWEGPKDRRAAGDGKIAVDYSGASFMSQDSTARGADRLQNLLSGTAIAILQFNALYSEAEYLMLDSSQALIAGLLSSFTSISSLTDILDIIDAVSSLVSAKPPINRIQVLVADPADSEDVAAETGLFNPLDTFKYKTADVAKLGTTTADLLTETGAKKTGISFVDIRSGRNKALRLRVRLIHRHMLIFPFLRGVYSNVLDRRAVSADEREVIDIADKLGMVEVFGDAIMQMQSNLTLGDD